MKNTVITSKKIRKSKDFLRQSELAEKAETRPSTIKYYTELGLLPFEQEGFNLVRYYPAKESIKRIKEIKKLKKKGKTIPEIVEVFLG